MKDVLIYEDDDFSMIYKEGSLTKEDIEDLKNQVRTILKAKQTEPQEESERIWEYDCRRDWEIDMALEQMQADCPWK